MTKKQLIAKSDDFLDRTAKYHQKIGFFILAAILDAMLEFTVEKTSKLHIIYKKPLFIAIKTNFTHKVSDVFMHEKNTLKSFVFGSHLGCHIVSRLSYKLLTNNKVIF